jgi:hypothetical protein
MSATVTDHALDTIKDLFDSGGGFHIVHAVRLRPEPRFFWQRAANKSERRRWILDALAHLPRPAILYTTRRSDAISWYRDLCKLGYRRLGLIHGASTESERDQALESWRDDSTDLMVATSAFGLGVDKADVRAVLHATFPESLDRYYQDVGRGGRDGRASLALMIWTEVDTTIAERLARPTFIGTERGNERWRAMFESHNRRSLGGAKFAVPTDVSPSTRPEDIDMQGDENERWNQRTLLLLQRSGAITIMRTEVHTGEAGRRRPFAVIHVLEDRHLEETFWEEQLLPRRTKLLEAYDRGWQLMQSAVTAQQCLAFSLQEQYKVRHPRVDVVRACGSCPYCREHGLPPTAGQLRARFTSVVGDPVHMSHDKVARDTLRGDPLGFIFVEPNEETPSELILLADWFVRHGVRDLVLPPLFRREWLQHFGESELPLVFFHDGRVRGIRRECPAAAFLPSGVIPALAKGSFVILRADECQPDRPDRRLADVISSGWPLYQFLDRFVE